MLKRELREWRQHERAQYTPANVEKWSLEICQLFFATFDLRTIQALHIFLPIQRKNEVDTWPIIKKLRTDFPEIKIAVSVADTFKNTLTHFWLQPDTKLVQSKWGIPEPENAQPISVSEIDLVLVPLLAFDEKGHRVGYGKGFYDRFLAQCKPDTLKIGLSFEPPVAVIPDFQESDIALNFVITPTQIFKFI